MGSQWKPVESYRLLTLEVDEFNIRIGAAINYEIQQARTRFPDTKLYEFDSSIDLECRCLDPQTLNGHRYEITVFGSDPDNTRLAATLNDCCVLDADGEAKHRKVRGVYEPVYEIPPGISVLRKQRSKNRWQTAIWVPRSSFSEMLAILTGLKTQIYVSLNERQAGRQHWISSLYLQTSHPLIE